MKMDAELFLFQHASSFLADNNSAGITDGKKD
jgi:hypothetical protein